MPPDSLDLDALASALADRLVARLHAEKDRLLDRHELATRLGMSERAVGSMASRGEIPPGFLIGGLRRWNWNAVLHHLESRTCRRPRGGRGRHPRQ